MQTLRRVVLAMLSDCQSVACIGFILLALGAWLLLPLDTFGSNQVYGWIRTILPQWILGLMLAAVGIAALVSTEPQHRRWRYWVMLASVGANVAMMVIFWYGSHNSLGIPAFGALALVSAWSAIQAGRRPPWTI